MRYKIDSQNLIDYTYTRINDLIFKDRGHRLMDIEKIKDGIVLFRFIGGKVVTHKHVKKDLEDLRGDFLVIKPYFIPKSKNKNHDKIEIAIEAHKPGINGKDVCGFLESFVNKDQIFSRGNPLFSYERADQLPSWQKSLKRDYKICQGKMSCLVTDQNMSTERLRKTIYEYMVRPCIYYLFNMGNFSSRQ